MVHIQCSEGREHDPQSENVMSPIPQARRFGCSPNAAVHQSSSSVVFADPLTGMPSDEPGVVRTHQRSYQKSGSEAAPHGAYTSPGTGHTRPSTQA